MDQPVLSPFTQLVEKLQKRYPGANRSLLEELARAKLILMDTTYGVQVLVSLQQRMQQGQPLTLDDLLARVEQEQGFQHRKEVQNVLDRDTFMQHLGKREQLLDGGTPADHGPHTHRLQWYILYQ